MHETASLIDRARGGSESAWHALFAREERRVIAVLSAYVGQSPHRAEEIDELLQQVRVEAHGKIDDFEAAWPGAFGAWLSAIARNKALSARRNEARRQGSSYPEASDSIPSSLTTPSSRAVKRELEGLAIRALDRLTPDQREVIVLRFFERMTPATIAHSMNRTEIAVRALFYRALKALGQEARRLGL